MHSEIDHIDKERQNQSDILLKSFETDKRFLQKPIKYGSDIESPLFKPSEELPLSLESSTTIKTNESEYIRYLELQNSQLKSKLGKILKSSGVSEEFLETADKEIVEESYSKGVKSLEINKIKDLEKNIETTFEGLNEKISLILQKAQKCYRKAQDGKESVKKALKNLNEKEKDMIEKIKILEQKLASNDMDEKVKEAYKIIERLRNELKKAKSEIISPEVIIYIKDIEPDIQDDGKMQNNYEELVLTNMQLKSDLINNEGDLTKFRKLEEVVRTLKEKCELLEKVNKELTNKKNDSDDSLELDCSNIKELIEIQELRAALRSISERYEQEKEIILRDCEESRQDMETQMFRLKNEKTYIEVKFKDNEKLLIEMNRDKERQEGIISLLKKEIEKLKDCKIPDGPSRTSLSRRGSSEILQMSNSMDFELTESLDKFAAVNSNDLYEILMDEVNEMAMFIKDNQLVSAENRSSKDIISKFIETGIKIKNLITREVVPGTIIKDLSEVLADVLSKYKIKISILEQDKAEKDKRIEELSRNDRLEVQTEPSPRSSTPATSLDSDFFMRRQLQFEKSRLFEKKHEIHLHKEQIMYLKQNVRELQTELDRISRLDIGHLKEFWGNLGKEIPLLQGNAEDMIEVFTKMLGFNMKEIQVLNMERKSKKGKLKFGFFG